jgi:hypothetical protein
MGSLFHDRGQGLLDCCQLRNPARLITSPSQPPRWKEYIVHRPPSVYYVRAVEQIAKAKDRVTHLRKQICTAFSLGLSVNCLPWKPSREQARIALPYQATSGAPVVLQVSTSHGCFYWPSRMFHERMYYACLSSATHEAISSF